LHAGIYLASSTGGADEVIHVRIPHDYMNMPAGEYVYDMQIREKSNWFGYASNTGGIYSTWIKGMFNVVEDVTQL
jgi:hypothetical protein